MIKFNGKITFLVLLFIGILLFPAVNPLFSLEREGNIVLYVLLDRSLSMEEEIDDMKDYVENTLIDETLIPGDSFVLIEFYREPRLVFSDRISGDQDKRRFRQRIEAINADMPYTDIGLALDRLINSPEGGDFSKTRSHAVLLTDFTQEAPKGSPYAGTVHDFTAHPLLRQRRVLERGTWKICVIGPGVEERAERLAREVIRDRSGSN
jgi:hypothetical protein